MNILYVLFCLDTKKYQKKSRLRKNGEKLCAIKEAGKLAGKVKYLIGVLAQTVPAY